MRLDNRISKLEDWLCPAPIVPVHVYLILPGLQQHHDGQVYCENQFLENSAELIPGAVPCVKRLNAEHRNADGQVIQRFFIYETHLD